MPIVEKSGKLMLASAQINPVVGDIKGNSNLVIDAVKRAKEKGRKSFSFPKW